jgi:hypothetical protein
MATKKQPKQVMCLQGNTMELGQLLTNFFGMNPDVVVHYQVSTQALREKPTSSLLTPQIQPQYEPITVVYLVYSNPGDLNMGIPPAQATEDRGPVRANLKTIN